MRGKARQARQGARQGMARYGVASVASACRGLARQAGRLCGIRHRRATSRYGAALGWRIRAGRVHSVARGHGMQRYVARVA
jgi:hypothetical protein